MNWWRLNRWALIAIPIAAVVFMGAVWWLSVRTENGVVVAEPVRVQPGDSAVLSGLEVADAKVYELDPPVDDPGSRWIDVTLSTKPVLKKVEPLCTYGSLQEEFGDRRTFIERQDAAALHLVDDSLSSRCGADVGGTVHFIFRLPTSASGDYVLILNSFTFDEAVEFPLSL